MESVRKNMTRRVRRIQAREAAKRILSQKPKQDITVSANIFRALLKEINRKN